MPKWICAICDRAFARNGQSHVCEPTEPLDEYLARWSDSDRAIAELVIDAVDECGPVDVEAVQVGLFFKTTRSIAQLRPKHKRLELMIVVGRSVEGARVRRTEPFGTSYAIYTDLLTIDDVDDWIHELIFEAYDLNPGEAA